MRRLIDVIRWKTAASIYAASLEHGRDPAVRVAAREEIIRMGELLDEAQGKLCEIQTLLNGGNDDETDEI